MSKGGYKRSIYDSNSPSEEISIANDRLDALPTLPGHIGSRHWARRTCAG